MPLNTGQILEQRYHIDAMLGQGGMGAVYRATDMRFGATVAIKENRLVTPESQRQFSREAGLLYRLRHSNLPRVSDHFYIPAQGQYLVMDYVDGEDMNRVLVKGGPVLQDQALAWMRQVLDALEYLHSQGVIHRDVKPANIKITPGGEVFLVDFGLAKLFDSGQETTIGARGVTPGFAPPEQYGHGRTDARTDVYSAGATLYALLTSRHPPDALDFMMGRERLVPPRRIAPAVSEAVEVAILRAMQSRPEDRFQTAGEFRTALLAPFGRSAEKEEPRPLARRHPAVTTRAPTPEPLSEKADPMVRKGHDSLPVSSRRKLHEQPDVSDSAAKAQGFVHEARISRRTFIYAAAALGVASATAIGLFAADVIDWRSTAATQSPTKAPEVQPTAPAVVGMPFKGKTLRVHAISGANYDELYELVPSWEEETGATAEFVFKGNGFETDKTLVQDFAAGTVDYDVCWDHSSYFSQYVKADGIVPLDDYFSEEELSDFIPAILNAGRREGELWVIPRHYDISCIHWRTDLMSEDQVPKTWDEFKALAIQLTEDNPGIFGTQFAGKEEALSGRFYEVLLAEGGRLLDDNWMPAFNSPAGVKAATMFAELYDAGAMPPDMTNFLWEDVAQQWVNGLIGMYTEWYGWYGYFQDPESSQVAGKFDLARQPKGDGGIHSGWAGHHGFSITKASKEKEMAASFIKYPTSTEGNTLESDLGFTVVRQSVWDSHAIPEAAKSDNPLDKKRLELALLQAQEDFRSPPLIAEWLPLSNILYPIVQQIILGDVEAQKGLDDAAEKVAAMMKGAGY